MRPRWRASRRPLLRNRSDSLPPPRGRWSTPGNFEDDLARVADCQWIVEAVSEDLAVKRSLLERVAAVRAPGTILSTNTSGIPLAHIAEGFPAELPAAFSGHALLQSAALPAPAGSDSRAGDRSRSARLGGAFLRPHLGKGVVPCKDTPNFIANRIGCFFGATIHKLTVEGDYTVEEVDALTGPLIGLPQERQLPPGGHRRAGRVGARAAQSARTGAARSGAQIATMCPSSWSA